jgi:hypothetical protein
MKWRNKENLTRNGSVNTIWQHTIMAWANYPATRYLQCHYTTWLTDLQIPTIICSQSEYCNVVVEIFGYKYILFNLKMLCRWIYLHQIASHIGGPNPWNILTNSYAVLFATNKNTWTHFFRLRLLIAFVCVVFIFLCTQQVSSWYFSFNLHKSFLLFRISYTFF